MSSLRTDPRFRTLSQPSTDALALLDKVLMTNPVPVIAEIGVGVGATTLEFCKRLRNRGEIHLFDFAETLDRLKPELAQYGNLTFHANGRKTFDSYAWLLAKMLLSMRRGVLNGIYDFVYLDGAHAFQHDAPAALCLKELLKPGGILLFDDYLWTFAKSPTANPQARKSTAESYSQEQIDEPHIALICELFFDGDSNFTRVDLGYTGREQRRAYRKLA